MIQKNYFSFVGVLFNFVLTIVLDRSVSNHWIGVDVCIVLNRGQVLIQLLQTSISTAPDSAQLLLPPRSE